MCFFIAVPLFPPSFSPLFLSLFFGSCGTPTCLILKGLIVVVDCDFVLVVLVPVCDSLSCH
jgi:hypothetical protein